MGQIDVRVLITAAADQLRKELAGAGSAMEGFGQRVSAGLNGASERLTGLGGKMSLMVSGPLAALGGGMLALVKRTATLGDELAKNARSVGISGEAFQELEFAIGQATNASEGELGRALENLNRNLGDFAAGGASDGLAAAFERIGVSMADIRSGAVGTDQAFTAVVAALQETESAAAAASLGAELLGSRVGRALGPQLREVGGDVAGLREQFRELGLGLSGETLAASEQFNDQLDVMGRQFTLAGNKIGEALLPVLVDDLMPFVIDTVIPGLIAMGEAVGGLIRWFTELPAPVQSAVGIVAAALGAGGPIILALGVLAQAFAAIIAVGSGPIGLFILAATAAVTAWTLWGDQIQAVVGATLGWLQETFIVFGEWWNEFWGALFEGFRATFGSAFTFITDTTLAVTEAVKAAFETLGIDLVFGSIIPDMWDAIEARWAQGVAALKTMSATVSSNTTRQFAGMVSSIIGQFQTMLAAWESNSQAMFIAQRTAAIAQALVATFTGIAQALTWGWPMGPIFAAIIGGIGFAQVAAIAATSFGGSGGGGKSKSGGGGGGGSSSGLVRAAAQPPAAPAPAAQPEGGRTEITIHLEGGEGRRYAREEIELILEGINEALGDNATLKVRS